MNDPIEALKEQQDKDQATISEAQGTIYEAKSIVATVAERLNDIFNFLEHTKHEQAEALFDAMQSLRVAARLAEEAGNQLGDI